MFITTCAIDRGSNRIENVFVLSWYPTTYRTQLYLPCFPISCCRALRRRRCPPPDCLSRWVWHMALPPSLGFGLSARENPETKHHSEDNHEKGKKGTRF